MNRTILGIYGRADEGKSTIAKLVCQILVRKYPNSLPTNTVIDYSGDILVTLTVEGLKIGIESQGDPRSRMFHTLKQLGSANCDIIICTTRTTGSTVNEVDHVADTFGYNTLWISSFYTPSLNTTVLNDQAAKNIVEIVEMLITGTL